jgi:hypothetical protein
MRVIDVTGLGCRAIVVDCDDERILLVDAGLPAEARLIVLHDALAVA